MGVKRPTYEQLGEMVEKFRGELQKRTQAEEELRESEQRHRLIFENAADGILLADRKTKKFYMGNKQICEALGYSPEEIKNLKIRDIHPEEDLPYVLDQFEKLARKEISVAKDIPVKRKDGSVYCADISGLGLVLGEKACLIGVFRDITSRKKAEEAIRASETRYRRLFESAKDGVLILDADTGEIVDVNPFLIELLDYSHEEFIGKKPWEICFLKDRQECKATFQELQKKGYVRYESLPLETKHGRSIDVEFVCNSYSLNHRKVVQCNIRDITERKRLEKTLQENEKLYRLLAENTNDMITRHLPDSTYLYISPACRTLFGYDPEELLGTKAFDLIHPEDVRRVITISQEAVSTGELRMGQYRHLKKDGQYIWVETVGKVIKDEVTGDIKDIICVVRDITDRKQAEETLRRSGERFKQVANNLGEWIWEVDTDGLYTYSNPILEKILGYKPEEVVGKMHFYDFFTPEKKEELKKAAFEVFARKESFKGFVNPNLHKNGTLVILETGGAPVLDQQGRLLGYCGGDTDITARKRAEEALRESEERFRQMVDTMNNCVATYEARANGDDFIFKDFNRAAERVENVTRENVLGRSVLKVFPEVKEFGLFEVFQRVWKTGKPESHPAGLYKDNRISGWRENFVYKLPSGEVVVIYDDVTARKQAEEKLRYNLNFLNILIDTIPSPLYSKDVNGIYLSCNKNFAEQILGLPREKIIGRSLYELSHAIPRNLADIYHQQDMKLLQNPGVQVYEVKVQCADGIQRDFIFYKATFTDAAGKIAGIVGVMLDITDRKEAENDLQESETKFRAVFEQTFQLIGLLGLDGTLVEVNTTALNFTGAEASHVLGKPFWETPWWTHSAEMQERLRVAIKAATNGGDDRFEATHLAGDGSLHYLDFTLKPVIDDAGHILFLIAEGRDITERKQAEEQMLSLQSQLQQSQKMEAIGRLAGGVAHDFNNLLTVISVQAQLGLRGLREGDPLKEKLKDIELAADRAANLTRQLLAFSRRQILEMKVINLNIILTDMEKMLIRVIGEDIELKTLLADDLGLVKVDPGQMEQVIVNLAVNAKDAMPKGGKLLLETANAELDEEYTRSHVGMIPGAYVLLSITDTGVGMTEEVREQIFDPFFTTKGKGKGTGLGLSTVYGIVKQSSGDIYVYSEPGKGTTFKIYLPRVFEPPEELKKVTVEEIPRGKETILVVEDDRMVRRLAVDILRRQGYRVLEAEAGGEALVMCEKEKDPIDLILTDIVMPHMGGPELIERLKQVRKDFKVLYMTGYTDEAIVEHGILEEGIELIHKPFTIQKLSRKVREVLDKN